MCVCVFVAAVHWKRLVRKKKRRASIRACTLFRVRSQKLLLLHILNVRSSSFFRFRFAFSIFLCPPIHFDDLLSHVYPSQCFVCLHSDPERNQMKWNRRRVKSSCDCCCNTVHRNIYHATVKSRRFFFLWCALFQCLHFLGFLRLDGHVRMWNVLRSECKTQQQHIHSNSFNTPMRACIYVVGFSKKPTEKRQRRKKSKHEKKNLRHKKRDTEVTCAGTPAQTQRKHILRHAMLRFCGVQSQKQHNENCWQFPTNVYRVCVCVWR